MTSLNICNVLRDLNEMTPQTYKEENPIKKLNGQFINGFSSKVSLNSNVSKMMFFNSRVSVRGFSDQSEAPNNALKILGCTIRF